LPRIIAVTGATGFVGQALCQTLLDQGFQVRALVRNPARAESLRTSGVKLLVGNFSDTSTLTELITGSDAVIHCAGAVRGATQEDFDRVNVQGLKQLIQVIQTSNPKTRLLCLSSLVAREPALSFYATSKFRAEQVLQTEAQGLQWTVIRPPAVYGPGDKELLPLFKLIAKGFLPVPGSADSRLSIIHINDLVSAIIAWLEQETPAQGIYAVEDGCEAGYSWRDLGTIVGTLTGRKVRLVPLPGCLLDTFARINSALAKRLGYAPMLTPEKLRELRHRDWVCSSEAFSQQFNWQPQLELQQGLEQTPGWKR
jgi:nucleoside-diphosphate-sugar epimerase